MRYEANMTRKVAFYAIFSICTAFITVSGADGFVAHADDAGSAVYSGVNQLRQGCGPITDDPRLTEAAQRHADDMLRSGSADTSARRLVAAGTDRAGGLSEPLHG